MKTRIRTAWERLRAWVAALPPIMAPSVEFPLQAEIDTSEPPEEVDRELALFVVTLPPGLLSWLVTHIPFGETISREEAAATLLQREIQVRYRPMIIEMDKVLLEEKQ
jgi:hypothetical protein